jgi:DNA-binding CsgD family transcriptional regulator
LREPSHSQALDFLMRAPGYEDAQALEKAFASALEALGVTAFSCARQDARSPAGPPEVMAQKGVDGWDRYMADQGYFAINPCVRMTALGRTAFTWRELQAHARRSGEASEGERRLWADAADNGLRDGLVVRTVAPSGQVLAMRLITSEPRIRASDRPLLETLAIVFSSLRHRFHAQAAETPADAALTPREAECLRWAAQGLPDHGIAERLGISGNTVRNHMQNAMRKLAAPTRLAAYHRALNLGAI